MCNLCIYTNGGTDIAAKKRIEAVAARLKSMSFDYESLVNGSVKPHSDDSKIMGVLARILIRDLVEDWL